VLELQAHVSLRAAATERDGHGCARCRAAELRGRGRALVLQLREGTLLNVADGASVRGRAIEMSRRNFEL
jgi:hypothetical protein